MGYNIQGDLLAQGINCVVRVSENENGSNPIEIGFVSEASIRKAINIQRAECIGQILPISLDPTGIQVTVTLRGFVPSRNLVNEGITTKQGDACIHLKSFNPNDDKLIDTRVATKIPYLELYDRDHDSVIGSTTWLIATAYDDSISGKGYLQANCTLEGIGYENGDDYPGEF